VLRILNNFSYVSCNEHRITLYFETAFKGYEMHASEYPFTQLLKEVLCNILERFPIIVLEKHY